MYIMTSCRKFDRYPQTKSSLLETVRSTNIGEDDHIGHQFNFGSTEVSNGWLKSLNTINTYYSHSPASDRSARGKDGRWFPRDTANFAPLKCQNY